MKKSMLGLMSLAMLTFVSCEKKETVNTNPESTTTSTTTTTNTTPPATAPETTAQPAATALATKVVGDYTVMVDKCSVNGNVLTIDFHFKPNNEDPKTFNPTIYLKDINYIDNTTTKKVSLLKDDQGALMASPAYNSNDPEAAYLNMNDNLASNYSFRFPAPDPATTNISLNLPSVGSVDIPVSR